MDFFDLNTLRKSNEQDNLFNFFEPTFKLVRGTEQQIIVVGKESEMRADLICHELYGQVDQVDFLMSLNDIDNPLNIMEKDTLFYTSYSAIDNFRIKNTLEGETRKKLLNEGKAVRPDKNRAKFVEDGFNLAPNQSPIPRSPITIEDNNIILG